MGVTTVLDKSAWLLGATSRGIGSTFLTRDKDMIAMHILFLAYAFILDVGVDTIHETADVATSHIYTHIKRQLAKFQQLADFYSVEVMSMCIQLVEKLANDSKFIEFVETKRNYKISSKTQKAKNDMNNTVKIIKDNSFKVPSLFQIDLQYEPILASLNINLTGTPIATLLQVCRYSDVTKLHQDNKSGRPYTESAAQEDKHKIKQILYDLI